MYGQKEEEHEEGNTKNRSLHLFDYRILEQGWSDQPWKEGWIEKSFRKCFTYLINIHTPVGCIARHIPFHDAVIVCFWRALNGNRGSGAAGGGGSLGPNVLLPPDFVLAANLPNSQPIFYYAQKIRFYSDFIFFFYFFNLLSRVTFFLLLWAVFTEWW